MSDRVYSCSDTDNTLIGFQTLVVFNVRTSWLGIEEPGILSDPVVVADVFSSPVNMFHQLGDDVRIFVSSICRFSYIFRQME